MLSNIDSYFTESGIFECRRKNLDPVFLLFPPLDVNSAISYSGKFDLTQLGIVKQVATKRKYT